MSTSIKRILIANRGEIALRVIRSCKKLGIKTVAVYSEADRNALHVREADQAFLLGPAPSNQSYLRGDKIIEIARNNQVDAIHPGYGFLSENAEFSRMVTEAGIRFIGPSPEAITLMGSKIASKQAVDKYGVPLVPGTQEAVEDPEEAKRIAKEIGFPVLIKASAGGGGKGMRIVHSESELESGMNSAINEAKASFGDGAVFIEKYVGSPRHIEIQVLADNHGNVVHLFERECSIQRRHQKLVEEAPSSILTDSLRNEMGEAAVNVAKACNYSGAGTVEFLMDESMNFYFLEMNTRLQVEHPVTELITGVDLVEQQIAVAEDQPLFFQQSDLSINGHSIELRLCAEDPEEDFLPALGELTTYNKPTQSFVRVDDCVEEGYEIPIHYDNMFAKLIVWGTTRDQAINRLKEAIDSFEIDGLKTTLDFGRFVMNHEAFVSGNFDTHFVQKHYSPEALRADTENEEKAAAVLSFWLNGKANKPILPVHGQSRAWQARKDS
jgi:propionyl-CoA carboxylase alpha chain